MRRTTVTAGGVVQEFNRRRIAPDEEHAVNQGWLRLWLYNQQYVAELYCDSVDGKTFPGMVSLCAGSAYINTNSPQDIADDLTSQLHPTELIDLKNAHQDMIPISQAERDYNLPTGTIRRDIHREKFNLGEVRKIGRDWVITKEALENKYAAGQPGKEE